MTHLPKMAPDLSRPHAPTWPGADGELTLRSDPAIGTVVERFAVNPRQLETAIAAVMNHVETVWMEDPSFVGMALLRDRSEASLAAYVQWRRDETKNTSAALSEDRSLQQVMHPYSTLLSERYEVAFSLPAPGQPSPSVLSLTGTPYVHFGIFKVLAEHQEELLRRAATYGPNSFGVPGIQSINFHRGRSGRDVLNLGLWTTFEQFAQLFNQPGFSGQNEYFRDLAEFKAAFFDVIAVKAANSSKFI